ncbi:UPF0103-domain-containing protein [Pseudovirgaria hyperparasitica]|uniref:UPF0103-domain-containing protein n=1 Tax=Pseudovirgaria hyperparasitica TaxID=470096 RepID=A0A6A6W0C6_9PEZI|nr:UPF0103-domain-containing protein [Pseudovirgaria hyperparasitica]KAF2754521.1 UPF0103-domain-containing protein [Pseudovirgaria hyperparasitica]
MPSREATHAGSWYTDNGPQLDRQLSGWLDQVPTATSGIGAHSSTEGSLQIPSTGARAIIAPHAGFSYSGPAAAWAYKSLDLSNVKRVFLLGPSHHYYLTTCALSRCDTYETPLGDLKIDLATVKELEQTGAFEKMSQSKDEAEHSLEMHLPYIYKMLSTKFSNPAAFPPLIPILVGATTSSTEKRFGEVLAPYLADPTSIFVISSDFCHWGSRFRYTYYVPESGSPKNLGPRDQISKTFPIHESIKLVDQWCMDAVETGSHDNFQDILDETNNTVCGRHPIGVIMAAIEALDKQGMVGSGKGKFKFVRYERSSLVDTYSDSSVSYCSAFAIL